MSAQNTATSSGLHDDRQNTASATANAATADSGNTGPGGPSTNVGNAEAAPYGYPIPSCLGEAPSAPGVYLHSSMDPSRSLNLPSYPSQIPPGQCMHNLETGTTSKYMPFAPTNHQAYPSASAYSATSYYPPQQPMYTMDYKQLSAPLPPGAMSFQPPVPDTTYGWIPHLYVPRSDGGVLGSNPGVQYFAGANPSIPPIAVATAPAPVFQPQSTQAATLGQQMGAQAIFISGQAPPTSASGYPMAVPHIVPGSYAGMNGPPPAYMAATAPMSGYQAQPMMTAAVPGGAGGSYATMYGVATPQFPGTQQPPYIPASSASIPPPVSGIGRTRGETTLEQIEFAMANGLYEAQDFKPRDDDPSRFYWFREVDGNWTQRNRFTIDFLAENARWYLTDDGVWYAIRLPE